MASTANNHTFQVDEIVTIKASNDCDLCYGKIKKIHDDNVHYDIEQIPSNEIKRGLNQHQIEMVALIQYVAYIREKGSPPKWPMELINYAEENGIANKWIKYVDAKWVIDNKPDINNYKRLPPPIRQKPKKVSKPKEESKERHPDCPNDNITINTHQQQLKGVGENKSEQIAGLPEINELPSNVIHNEDCSDEIKIDTNVELPSPILTPTPSPIQSGHKHQTPMTIQQKEARIELCGENGIDGKYVDVKPVMESNASLMADDNHIIQKAGECGQLSSTETNNTLSQAANEDRSYPAATIGGGIVIIEDAKDVEESSNDISSNIINVNSSISDNEHPNPEHQHVVPSQPKHMDRNDKIDEIPSINSLQQPTDKKSEQTQPLVIHDQTNDIITATKSDRVSLSSESQRKVHESSHHTTSDADAIKSPSNVVGNAINVSNKNILDMKNDSENQDENEESLSDMDTSISDEDESDGYVQEEKHHNFVIKHVNMSQSSVQHQDPIMSQSWNCSVCTFKNYDQRICIMCNQGRHPELMQETVESNEDLKHVSMDINIFNKESTGQHHVCASESMPASLSQNQQRTSSPITVNDEATKFDVDKFNDSIDHLMTMFTIPAPNAMEVNNATQNSNIGTPMINEPDDFKQALGEVAIINHKNSPYKDIRTAEQIKTSTKDSLARRDKEQISSIQNGDQAGTQKHENLIVYQLDQDIYNCDDRTKPWNCSICTFENAPDKRICSICRQGVRPQMPQELAEAEQKEHDLTQQPAQSSHIAGNATSIQAQLMYNLINDAITKHKHKSPLLSTALGFKGMSAFFSQIRMRYI